MSIYKKAKTHTFQFRLSEPVHEALSRQAEARDVSMAKHLRDLIKKCESEASD
jgi:predicted HicB family RNase H-like nuclease